MRKHSLSCRRGLGRGVRGQRLDYFFQDSIQRISNFIIAETNCPEPFLSQIAFSHRVIPLRSRHKMRRSIDLYHQPFAVTEKINNERADRYLPLEFISSQSFCTQFRPQDHLRGRLSLPQALSEPERPLRRYQNSFRHLPTIQLHEDVQNFRALKRASPSPQILSRWERKELLQLSLQILIRVLLSRKIPFYVLFSYWILVWHRLNHFNFFSDSEFCILNSLCLSANRSNC